LGEGRERPEFGVVEFLHIPTGLMISTAHRWLLPQNSRQKSVMILAVSRKERIKRRVSGRDTVAPCCSTS
jgi:hypothetical protein